MCQVTAGRGFIFLLAGSRSYSGRFVCRSSVDAKVCKGFGSHVCMLPDIIMYTKLQQACTAWCMHIVSWCVLQLDAKAHKALVMHKISCKKVQTNCQPF